MIVEEVIGYLHVGFVEAIVSCLVLADKQNCDSPGVKCIKDPKGPAATLNSEFSEGPVARALDVRGMRVRQVRTALHQ